MSSLTDQERIGLEEVFLSINPKREQTLLQRIQKSVDHWLLTRQERKQKHPFFSFNKAQNLPHTGYFRAKFSKKKKSLS